MTGMTKPWRKSTRCFEKDLACVEVGAAETAVLVRDSTDPDGPRIALDRAAFAGLLGAIKEERRG